YSRGIMIHWTRKRHGSRMPYRNTPNAPLMRLLRKIILIMILMLFVKPTWMKRKSYAGGPRRSDVLSGQQGRWLIVRNFCFELPGRFCSLTLTSTHRKDITSAL